MNKRVYVYSYSARKLSNDFANVEGRISTGCAYLLNDLEAQGFVYQEAQNDFPSLDGWHGHSQTVFAPLHVNILVDIAREVLNADPDDLEEMGLHKLSEMIRDYFAWKQEQQEESDNEEEE
jgi:hypothetical protein